MLHVDGGIERRHASGIADVQVRAFLDEQRGDVIMSIDHRDIQRRRPVGVADVEIRAGVGECTYTVTSALSSGKHQGGQSATRQRREHHRRRIDLDLGELRHCRIHVQIGATGRKQRDHRGMILRGRPHQRGFSVPGFARIDVRSAIKQRPHRLRFPRPRREHQHRLAIGAHGVRVRAGLQQRLDNGRAAVDRSQGQRA